MSKSAPPPFSRRGALALVLFGAMAFVALLWLIGSGQGFGSSNDGGAHAGGRGLNGYAAFARLLEKRGIDVRLARHADALRTPALLVLTPPHDADGKELDRIVSARRRIGPTLIVTPKWPATPARGADRTGWVMLAGAQPPKWSGFLDDLSVTIRPMSDPGWMADGARGALPDGRAVLSGSGSRLVPLVAGRGDGRTLAGYLADGGDYPALQAMAMSPGGHERNESLYPLVVVFEPDLLDNWGMARPENARLAEALVRAASKNAEAGVTFDLTLNGHGRSANLLTLAITPPFLAATLCLLLAALVAGWRAFVRFGPPIAAVREIAFGKRALVANAAGLIRRSKRLHLIADPYADRSRERLIAALSLPHTADRQAAEAAIDRAVQARGGGTLFSVLAARLRAARRPHDLVKAAQDLHALERTLIR